MRSGTATHSVKASGEHADLANTMTDTTHDTWVERAAAVKQPIMDAFATAAAKGDGALLVLIKALAQGFCACLAAPEKRVQNAFANIVSDLAVEYTVKMSPLAFVSCGAASHTVTHTILDRVSAPDMPKGMRVNFTQALRALLFNAPSVKALKIVLEHAEPKRVKTAECAATLLTTLLQVLPDADIDASLPAVQAAMAKLVVSKDEPTRTAAEAALAELAEGGRVAVATAIANGVTDNKRRAKTLLAIVNKAAGESM